MAAEVQRGGPPGSENDAEEKQRRADAKMAEMQAKNDRMRKRYEEVEADKKNANLLSKMAGLNMKDEPTPGGGGRSLAIEPEFFSRGRGKQLAVQQQYANNKKMGHTTASESTKPGSSAPPPDPKFGFLHDPSRQGPLPPGHIAAQKAPSKMVPNARGDNGSPLQRGLGRGSSRASHQPPTKQEMEATMTGRERKEYEQWRQERENIDRERLDRAKTSQGEWKREWDKEKQEGQLKQPQNRSDESRGSGGIHGNFVPHSHSGGGHHNSPRDLGHDRERGNGGPPSEDNAYVLAASNNSIYNSSTSFCSSSDSFYSLDNSNLSPGNLTPLFCPPTDSDSHVDPIESPDYLNNLTGATSCDTSAFNDDDFFAVDSCDTNYCMHSSKDCSCRCSLCVTSGCGGMQAGLPISYCNCGCTICLVNNCNGEGGGGDAGVGQPGGCVCQDFFSFGSSNHDDLFETDVGNDEHFEEMSNFGYENGKSLCNFDSQSSDFARTTFLSNNSNVVDDNEFVGTSNIVGFSNRLLNEQSECGGGLSSKDFVLDTISVDYYQLERDSSGVEQDSVLFGSNAVLNESGFVDEKY